MATNSSPFIVNIVDLQNIATSITGSSQETLLSKAQSDIANLQEMVDYTTKTISVDFINSFTQSNIIQVLADMNLSNTSLYVNNTSITSSQSPNISSVSSSVSSSISSIVSSIGGLNSFITVNDLASTITFTTAGIPTLELVSTGMLKYTSSTTYFSTGISVGGFLYVSENAYAKNWFQTSDSNLKTNIQPFITSVEKVLELQPQHFTWKNTGSYDIGFIAQDVKSVWPELTTISPDGSMNIAYSRFVPLLLESIRELHSRVSTLESSHLKTI
jgi:hypothetical protein